MIAYIVRDETSRRARVRRSNPIVSFTSQSWRCCCSVASTASTASASPRVFRIQVPTSISLVRRHRIASSSSRAIASGHQPAPAAWMAATSVGWAAAGADTVSVAVRALRSTATSTCW